MVIKEDTVDKIQKAVVIVRNGWKLQENASDTIENCYFLLLTPFLGNFSYILFSDLLHPCCYASDIYFKTKEQILHFKELVNHEELVKYFKYMNYI